MRRLVLAGLLTLPLLTACQTSTSSSCFNNLCHVTIKGLGTTWDPDDRGVTVRLMNIDGQSADLNVNGVRVTLRAGQSNGPLKVTSVSPDSATVKFDIRV